MISYRKIITSYHLYYFIIEKHICTYMCVSYIMNNYFNKHNNMRIYIGSDEYNRVVYTVFQLYFWS